jgi:hypothetical protein
MDDEIELRGLVSVRPSVPPVIMYMHLGPLEQEAQEGD